MEVINTIGRRKTAVARIYMKPGSGVITINGRPFEEYFPTEVLRTVAMQALTLVNEAGKFDIKANLDGGGIAGQAEAFRLATARALVEYNPEYRAALKEEGYLRRDPRMVERKKYGRAKARKRFQWTKR
ncbi:MAG: 30S ribosomal protein S9 [Thermonema sp.]|jgi:small subunit ribosomal protein S9|uniref:Small ribosomal subunit protein uS9 n=1 Tax=Thermonema lapsum TaxID=28195 RepID=A0A846MQ70_9BACT|nr:MULTISPECIES: 30S ribosomal protein S9 [Thermonema]NIK73522.1 small subunit ribosomal protein S9 [Thermonema lapsum]GIV40410.1 MAG: 30S ribosomal protein S9 [Thermonema sp.]